jgi:hypothetical protein
MNLNHIVNMQLANSGSHVDFTLPPVPPHYVLSVQNAGMGADSSF